MSINMIVAVCENGVIGSQGKLPWDSLPGDMARFRKRITGQSVVMGKGTYDSLRTYFPQHHGHPLAGENIVLSAGMELQEGLTVCRSPQEVLDKYADQTLLVIGGGETYKTFLPYADKVELTWVDQAYKGDSYFPLSELRENFQEDRHEPGMDAGTEYITYIRKH